MKIRVGNIFLIIRVVSLTTIACMQETHTIDDISNVMTLSTSYEYNESYERD